MGVYYYYVNESKREFFCIDPTGVSIKNYALGHNIGSRALCYLLLQNNPEYTGVEHHPLVGSWIGDRFFITGDDYCPIFDAIELGFTNIDQVIVDMLVDIAPHDLFQYGGADWLIRLIEVNGEHIAISDRSRKRLLKEFRQENHLRANEDLERVISALRAKSDL